MNILLVALDTVRADHLGCYGYGHATSPTLDQFAAEGTRFARFYAPAIPTMPSYTTTFTGQFSITHGVVAHGQERPLDPVRPWLPLLLTKAGYTTCAVDNLGTAMRPYFARGYEFYIDPTMRSGKTHSAPCEDINARALPWLRSHARERFFLFVHYWDAHTPYLPPERYRGLFYQGDPSDPAKQGRLHEFYNTSMHAGLWRDQWINSLAPAGRELTDIEYLTAMYDAEIRHLDDGMAALLKTLDETGVADDTLVLIFADHGEEMHEHDVFFDHHGLYEGNIHVPLLARGPGVKRGVVPHFARHVDLAPTILEAAGLPVPQAMEGTSLLPYLRGERATPITHQVITQECTYQKKWAILRDRWKVIVSRETDRPDLHKRPSRELYNLAADPGEVQNLAADRPEVVRELEAQLDAWIAAKIDEHKLSGDPLLEQDITIGKGFRKWLEEHHYW